MLLGGARFLRKLSASSQASFSWAHHAEADALELLADDAGSLHGRLGIPARRSTRKPSDSRPLFTKEAMRASSSIIRMRIGGC